MDAHSLPRRWTTAGAVLALACVLIFSRALLAPKFLYFFDSVNFALALDDFNPALHQPQPPGYPFFVLIAKAVFGFVGNPQQALVITGIFGAAATMALVWRLGYEMFGARPALFATMILLFNPPFWFGGLTNQVRVFLAVAGAAVLYAGWRSVREESPKWFYWTAALLGIMSGFRPDVLAFGGPLVLYIGFRARRSVAQWMIASFLGAITVVAWVMIVASAVGGVPALMNLVQNYANDQFRSTSVVFGAQSDSALRMFLKALIWYGVPVLTWLIVVPFARGVLAPLKSTTGLLVFSIVPAFVFHAVLHVGDPDHTLYAVPALCVLGGLIVSRVRWAPAVATGVMALNALVFFVPPRGIAQACSFGAVRHADVITRETFRQIEQIRKTGPVTLVVHDHQVSWRHLYYYYPDVPLLVLHQDPRNQPDPKSAWLLYQRKVQNPVLASGEIGLPPGRNVWLLSHGRGMHHLLAKGLTVEQPSAFLAYSDTRPGMHFRFGDYRFSAKSPI